MSFVSVPTRDFVTEPNQSLFDKLQAGLGFVPNLYATLARSDTALGDYLKLQNRSTSLSLKEKEVVSQVNQCRYCLAAHKLLAQKAAFTKQQTIELRVGSFSIDAKFDALAKFVQSGAINRGMVTDEDRAAIRSAGYTDGHVLDMIVRSETRSSPTTFTTSPKYRLISPKHRCSSSRKAGAIATRPVCRLRYH